MLRPHKPRLLWIAVKLFDKSVDKATWLETMSCLDEDFDVHFLTAWRDKPQNISVCGKPVRYFPQYGRGFLRKVTRHLLMKKAARKEIAGLSPDLILLNCNHNLGIAKSVLKVSKRIQAPVILDVRTLPSTESSGPAWESFGKNLDFACRSFAGVTYITDEMRRYCADCYRLPEHQSAIWTSGVNADAFGLAKSAPDDGPFRLIYHGGIISANRGLDRLIQAIDLVRELDVRLTLISSLREPEAIDWIDKLNLHDHVTLIDTIPHQDVPAQIQRCHAGILPFPSCDIWNTSSPIKLFEYMACGKAVIVTDIPAHRNVLDGRPFAFFAPDASPKALAGAIRQAHAHRDQFGPLGQAAREQVLAEHTWARQAERLTLFLKQLLDR